MFSCPNHHYYFFQGVPILNKDFRFALLLSMQTLQEDLIFPEKQWILIYSEQLGDAEAGCSEGDNLPWVLLNLADISDEHSPLLQWIPWHCGAPLVRKKETWEIALNHFFIFFFKLLLWPCIWQLLPNSLKSNGSIFHQWLFSSCKIRR